MPGGDERREMEARLKALSLQQEERLARHRAQLFSLPYVSLLTFPMDAETLLLIPKEEARAAGAVLFYKHGRDMRMGAVNPSDERVVALRETVAKRVGYVPQMYVISRHSHELALSRYTRSGLETEVPKDELLVSGKRLTGFEESIVSLSELGERISSVSPSEILTTIMAGAVKMRASDIHVEPRQDDAQLRYRVDGVLHNIALFGKDGWRQVLSRIKVLGSLKLNVRDMPQEGSFVLRIDSGVYDIRISVLPGGFGENIVLRLLNRQEEGSMTLTGLGMKERDYKVVLEELKQSTGMVLTAGPTGSGKTTTIAACIRHINRPELKVISLEDPIEYRLSGVEQTEINEETGYTFAVGLRSILRQDPDVIFVGEMRDAETAETAVQASMTGHLVFSTLHANDGPGVVLRMVDIGIKPYVLAPALNLVIAQRLVRAVCENCAEAYTPSAHVREHIKEVLAGVAQSVFNPKVLDDRKLQFVRAKGCVQCGGTGYFGRVGVFELFAVRGELEELILRGAPGTRIREVARAGGMTTIAQDAYLKVIAKVTTVEEVQRISDE